MAVLSTIRDKAGKTMVLMRAYPTAMMLTCVKNPAPNQNLVLDSGHPLPPNGEASAPSHLDSAQGDLTQNARAQNLDEKDSDEAGKGSPARVEKEP